MQACALKNLNLQSLTVTIWTYLGLWEPVNLCSCTTQMLTHRLGRIFTTSALLPFRVTKFQEATLILVVDFLIFFIFLAFLVLAGALHDLPQKLDPASHAQEDTKPEMLPTFHLRWLLELPIACSIFNFAILFGARFCGTAALKSWKLKLLDYHHHGPQYNERLTYCQWAHKAVQKESHRCNHA